MKKLFTILALSFCYFFQVAAQKETLEKIFDQYEGTDGVTSIKIAKPMFGMLSKLNIQDSELSQIKPLLNKIQGLKILIIENEGGNSKKLSNVASNILESVNKLNYQELMTVNNKEAKIKFLSGEAKDGILDNLLLNINSEGNNVLMMLDGKISMNDVNNLVNETQEVINSKPSKNNTSSKGSEERKVGAFSNIQVSNGIKVNFTQDQTSKVVVTTDQDKQQYIKTNVEGGTLKIYVDNKGQQNFNINYIIVDVQNPTLQKVQVNSGANFLTNGKVASNSINLDLSSAGSIIGEFEVKKEALVDASSAASGKVDINGPSLKFSGSSGSSFTLTGSVNNANIDVSSAATLNANGLKTKSTDVSASSAATARVFATDSLNSRTSSGATVKYTGNPKTYSDRNTSGGSTKATN